VRRYNCRTCGRNFSTQSFSSTYWLKRPDLQRPLFWRLISCSGLRQIAREFGLSHSTVQRQTERLGRHYLVFHEAARPRVPRETLVLDGFRTFEHGQCWPFDLNLLVGSSFYVYGFNDAELRRSGTMRPAQNVSDEHTAYPEAFARLGDRDIRHRSTSSRKSRTPSNPLFPVNLSGIGHSSSERKRYFTERRRPRRPGKPP